MNDSDRHEFQRLVRNVYPAGVVHSQIRGARNPEFGALAIVPSLTAPVPVGSTRRFGWGIAVFQKESLWPGPKADVSWQLAGGIRVHPG